MFLYYDTTIVLLDTQVQSLLLWIVQQSVQIQSTVVLHAACRRCWTLLDQT